jgi:hypothetical protein
MSEEGSMGDGAHHHSIEELCECRETKDIPHKIYNSNLDPIGDPAFRPSKTKLFPKWMSLLPKNVEREREHQQKGSGPGSCTPNTLSRPSTACPSPNIPNFTRHRPAAVQIPIDPYHTKRVFGNNRRRARQSQTTESIYMTPPESPQVCLSQRQGVSYPGASPTPMNRISRSVDFPSIPAQDPNIHNIVQDSYYSLSAESQAADPSIDESPPIMSPSLHQPSAPSVSKSSGCSSEYLDRYQQESSGARYQRYMARSAVPVIERIRRQALEKQSMTQAAKGVAGKIGYSERRVHLGSEEYHLNQTKEDLRKELRSLFCEE